MGSTGESTWYPPPNNGPGLPAGWEQAWDPATKAPYYFNTDTNQTQWIPPSANDAQAPPALQNPPDMSMPTMPPPQLQDFTPKSASPAGPPQLQDSSSFASAKSASQGAPPQFPMPGMPPGMPEGMPAMPGMPPSMPQLPPPG